MPIPYLISSALGDIRYQNGFSYLISLGVVGVVAIRRRRPRQTWTRERIISELDERLRRRLDIDPMALEQQNPELTIAFRRHRVFQAYALAYQRFSRYIYGLFGFDVPRTLEEERQIFWPSDEELRWRYDQALLRVRSSSQVDEVVASEKVALVPRAFEMLLKRRQWLEQPTGLGHAPRQLPPGSAADAPARPQEVSDTFSKKVPGTFVLAGVAVGLGLSWIGANGFGWLNDIGMLMIMGTLAWWMLSQLRVQGHDGVELAIKSLDTAHEAP